MHMSMIPLRKDVGIAFDGGGIKGLVVARGLLTLEKELRCKQLITSPKIKIMAGTSTGAIIASSIAIGMQAKDIVSAYRKTGQYVFPRLSPAWLPDSVKNADELLLVILRHSLYSNKIFIEALRETIEKHTKKADITLAELNEILGPDKVLILTVMNVNERRTRFLKSYRQNDGDWKLWEAILASCSVPPALPVWSRHENGQEIYYTDGSLGNYINPAYIVAREAVSFRGYSPKHVSVISFGTGWLMSKSYQNERGVPTHWRGIDWAKNIPDLYSGDAIRSQSLDVLESHDTRKIDFRRYQFKLEKDIPAESYADDETYAYMEKLGDEVGINITENHFAPSPNTQYDPEELYVLQKRYQEARKHAKNRSIFRKLRFL